MHVIELLLSLFSMSTVIIVISTVNHAALRAAVKKDGLHCEEREWNCFLSLRDPAALPGRPGHPTKSPLLFKNGRAAPRTDSSVPAPARWRL
jgi:hypothetical protein